MVKMKDETDTCAKRKRFWVSPNKLQTDTVQSLLSANVIYQPERTMMSINDATPFDWDRLRQAHPPLELEKTGLEPWATMAEEEAEEDVVNNPNHYNTGNVECIEAIEESMTPEAFRGYLKGNCMKYLWRYNYKGKPVQDLQKAQWYLAELIKELVFDHE